MKRDRRGVPRRAGDRSGGHGPRVLRRRAAPGHEGRRAHRRARRQAHHQRAHRRRARVRPREEGRPSASRSTTSAAARSTSRSCEIRDGVFSVKSTNGDTHLGGEDFDRRILDSLADTFQPRAQRRPSQGQAGPAAPEGGGGEGEARAVARRSRPRSTSRSSRQNAGGEPLHIVKTMTRSELELLTSDLVERDARPVREGARRRELHARRHPERHPRRRHDAHAGRAGRREAVLRARPAQGREPRRGRRGRRGAAGRGARRRARSRCSCST